MGARDFTEKVFLNFKATMFEIHKPDTVFRRRTGERTLGLVMFTSAWAIALWLLFMGYSKHLEHRNNPNVFPASEINTTGAEVRLVRNRTGHYVTNGYINSQPVIFLLDTGATNLSIPMHIAQALRLRPLGPQKTNTANGIITVFATQVRDVRIGSIVINSVAAHINPHMDGEQILLGMSFLKHIDFAQQGNMLVLRQPLQLNTGTEQPQ